MLFNIIPLFCWQGETRLQAIAQGYCLLLTGQIRKRVKYHSGVELIAQSTTDYSRISYKCPVSMNRKQIGQHLLIMYDAQQIQEMS